MKIKTKRGARRIRNQRVVCKRFVVTDYTGCSYITAGKWYEQRDGYVKNDHHRSIYIVRPRNDNLRCKHLKGVGTWQWGVL